MQPLSYLWALEYLSKPQHVDLELDKKLVIPYIIYIHYVQRDILENKK